jgi:aspartyl-tRNA(Asn)/glutamyl-tRNA(Gln) amidotransferase subunit B
MNFQAIIGLEIHIQLNTKSKLFCSCLNDPLEKHPNLNICPICLGHPGTLPVINEEAVKKVIKTALALNCQISEISRFERKNYFYPDLPKGYQISQYEMPLSKNGYLNIKENSGKLIKIRIRRIHLEEDTGKLIHFKDYSLIDFNRAGIPLMELVTEPDLRSAKQAQKFAKELQLILRYLNVSEADMEKGQMRIEANVSLISTNLSTNNINNNIREIGGKISGDSRVEIKNLNSFFALEKALDYEIKRQTKILKAGKKVIQETRGWDENREVTVPQREKEEAPDYRYFPEPDLPILETLTLKSQLLKEIPELPQAKRERFKREYQIPEKDIEVLVFKKELGEYFEKTVSELRNWIKEIEMKEKVKREEFLKLINLAKNYLLTDLQGLLKGASIKEILISPENFAEFLSLIYEGKISSKIAKMVLAEMFKTGADPSQIIEEKGLTQITEEKEIEKIVKKIIFENQKAVSDYKKGKESALQFLIGQTMRESKGRANPKIVGKVLKEILEKI